MANFVPNIHDRLSVHYVEMDAERLEAGSAQVYQAPVAAWEILGHRGSRPVPVGGPAPYETLDGIQIAWVVIHRDTGHWWSGDKWCDDLRYTYFQGFCRYLAEKLVRESNDG